MRSRRRSRGVRARRAGRFPRPNLTMRELIGLVLAFAVSNAFLSWIDPGHAASDAGRSSSLWNGLLAFYLGFAFLQAWIRSRDPMDADGRRGSRPASPTRAMDGAWGSAEATVDRRDDALLHAAFLFEPGSSGSGWSADLDWTVGRDRDPADRLGRRAILVADAMWRTADRGDVLDRPRGRADR